MGVSDIIIHALYNATNHDYDYALLKFLTPLGLNNLTQLITIPEQGASLPILGQLSLAGWGLLTVSFSL
jgi:flavoprotein